MAGQIPAAKHTRRGRAGEPRAPVGAGGLPGPSREWDSPQGRQLLASRPPRGQRGPGAAAGPCAERAAALPRVGAGWGQPPPHPVANVTTRRHPMEGTLEGWGHQDLRDAQWQPVGPGEVPPCCIEHKNPAVGKEEGQRDPSERPSPPTQGPRCPQAWPCLLFPLATSRVSASHAVLVPMQHACATPAPMQRWHPCSAGAHAMHPCNTGPMQLQCPCNAGTHATPAPLQRWCPCNAYAVLAPVQHRCPCNAGTLAMHPCNPSARATCPHNANTHAVMVLMQCWCPCNAGTRRTPCNMRP